MLVAPEPYERAQLKAFVAEQVEQECIARLVRIFSRAPNRTLDRATSDVARLCASDRIGQRLPQLLIEVSKQMKMQVYRMTSAGEAKILTNIVIIRSHQIVSHRW